MDKSFDKPFGMRDREAIQRRSRKEQHRQEVIEGLIAAHPTEACAKAYREATDAPQVA
jgi:hypothetical protein